MKSIFIKIICLFTFILTLTTGAFAQALNINSVIYDDSGAFLTLNSFDNNEYNFEQKPQIYIDEDGKKAYFDLTPAILSCPVQNIVLNNSAIEQVTVSQSAQETVRVAFSYSEGYNPKNVQLKKINNSLFLQFRKPVINNYYFQGVYLEHKDNVLFESIGIQTPVQVSGNSIIGQINSAFDIDTTKNFVLVKKSLALQSKYYIDNINFNLGFPVIHGIGSYTLSKPFYLTNPSRVVFDIQNAVVNPVIRNKELAFGNESLKIGQFDKNTARVVITSQNPEKYIPVIYPDTQKLVFIDKSGDNVKSLYSSQITMTASKYEKISSNAHSVKLVFNNPLIFGIDRSQNNLEVNLFNVGNYVLDSLKRTFDKTPFSNVKITNGNNGVVKINFPVENEEYIDIHVGSDGKTLRIKETFKKEKRTEVQSEINMPELDLQSIIPAIRKDGKKYVVIDPGHGGSDCGALRGNINEKDITLDISKRVEKLLNKKGYVVEMTRITDKTVSLQERVDISEAIMPDIFVSIHVNSSNSESPSGLETHYYKDNSLGLAKCIHAAMLNNINSNDRGLFKSKFYVINHTTAPAVLVEIGFLSNPKERAQLVSESRKEATAKAIAEGIDDYFKK